MTQITGTDQLIIDLIVNNRNPNKQERGQIISHIGSAGFRNSRVKVDPSLVGKQINNATIPSKLPSLHAHWLKRVYVDLEWSENCSPAAYLTDLQQAVMNVSAIHFGYIIERKIENSPITHYFVGCYCENNIPAQNKGSQHKPLIYVVYSASHGALVTGYQIEDIEDITSGGEIVWL